MKVLVTGGTGFVGSSLCAELAARDHEVTALARTPDASAIAADVETVAGDVTDRATIDDHVAAADAVVNLVALSPLYRPKGGPERHREVHLGGTENVVAAAEAHDVDLLVQMSGVHADPDADTAYLRAKGEAEAVVRAADIDHVVVRPTVLFGEGDEIRGFITTVAPPYLTPLPGGGSQRFQPLWVDDCASAMSNAIDDPSLWNATYAIGGPREYSLADLARLFHRANGRSATVVPVPMVFADVGLTLLGAVGGPLGREQARSLRKDLTVSDNEVGALGLSVEDLRTMEDFLGMETPA